MIFRDRVGAKSPIFDLFRQSYKAFTGLTILAKMIAGYVPLNVNFALSRSLLGAAAVLSRIVTNAVIGIAIITMEYQITNNVY